jgi:hypothetical protein
MPSSLFNLLSLFALFAASFSMLAEPVLEVLVDSPAHQCADTDSDADDDDNDDDKGKSLVTEAVLLSDTFTLESRVTLLSNVTTSSRNLAGDPRGPPSAPTSKVA